ncbi:MAG: hypothetical protein M1821_006698 [Bathelium mastoideum]|nr:MAG: hypothetical protein M1821_006698 [Bathelium mastoideum]
MPKKHNKTYNIQRGNYVHPSLASAKADHGEASSSSSATVNEKLNQLRIAQSPKPPPERIDQITAAITQKSVPPHLRAVLNIPETAAPAPRPGIRRRRPPDQPPGQPPGPAAPQSWMERSQHAPAHIRAQAQRRARRSTGHLQARLRPPNVHGLPGVEMPVKDTLLEQCFTAMAQKWEFISEYEQLNLATMPARLKSILLSYLAAFGPDPGINVGDLRLLFLTNNEVQGGTGTHDFRRCDLAGLIWGDLTLPRLEKYLLSTDKKASGDSKSLSSEILDSWDQEGQEITPALSTNRFSGLTHLSLARPDRRSPLLWSSLISIMSNLPRITHLSLAYWPAPSLTPNSNTASVYARGSPPVQMSGTGFYSHTLDDDFDEASNILRRLSLATVCLEWLDLEGCSEWWPALIWGIDEASKERRASFANHQRPMREIGQRRLPGQDSTRMGQATFDWTSQPTVGPDWNGPWRSIRRIKLGQGWVPIYWSDVPLQGISSSIVRSLQDYLDRGDDRDSSVERVEQVSRDGKIQWFAREQVAQNVHVAIQGERFGGAKLELDRGWAVS